MNHSYFVIGFLISLYITACGKSEPPALPEAKAGQKPGITKRPDVDNPDGGGDDGESQEEAERKPTITGDANSRVLDAPCAKGSSGPQVMEVDHFGSASDSFEVKTEWCLKGKQVGRLKLIFLVDHSGSMSRNDPLVDGSCGRLAAGKALIDKVQSQMQESDEITVAAITFGSRAELASKFLPIDDFAQSQLTPEVYCGAADQTNYEDAFQSAIELLRDAGDSETPVASYLLSDGLPSLGTEQTAADYLKTEAAALQAAKGFLANNTVSLNAIYLQTSTPSGTTEPDKYLAELTGGGEHVKIVANAQDLSASVTKFELPAPKTNLGSATATLTGKGKPRNLVLKSVEQDPSNANKILVTTERFNLTEADEEETNKYFIKLKIDVDDGTIQQTTIVINIKD